MLPLIIISGPTAVGKSNIAVRLASGIGGEIISADSIQVYRTLDIGSAKVTKEEMGGIKHHLIDILDPDEEYNVALFQKMGREAIEEIYGRGRIPIVTGGTGFYIQALVRDVRFDEQAENTDRRIQLLKEAEGKEELYLFHKLEEMDPLTASSIEPFNRKRIARAIEFFESTGRSLKEHNDEEASRELLYPAVYIVLTDDRVRLYQRIDERVDRMIERGLEGEVRRLYDAGIPVTATSVQGIGYKELYEYFEGRCSLDEAVSRIKINSRHFAKRQLTWFRREKDVFYIHIGKLGYDEEKIVNKIKEIAGI